MAIEEHIHHPDGRVEVVVKEPSDADFASLRNLLLEFSGTCPGLPADMAAQHDPQHHAQKRHCTATSTVYFVVAVAGEEPTADDEIRSGVERLDERIDVTRVVLSVGVQLDNPRVPFTDREAESGAQCAADTHVVWQLEHPGTGSAGYARGVVG